jgi:hypothetical protein
MTSSALASAADRLQGTTAMASLSGSEAGRV